ncbi:ATP-binding protein [Piscinibacter sakaiensis]
MPLPGLDLSFLSLDLSDEPPAVAPAPAVPPAAPTEPVPPSPVPEAAERSSRGLLGADALRADPAALPASAGTVSLRPAAEDEPPLPDPSLVRELDLSVPPPAAPPAAADDEFVKRIGPLRVPIPLFNIYLSEADEWSRRLGTDLAEWAMERHRPLPEAAIERAHALAGSSSTVGYQDLCGLARALEHALGRTAADELRRLLHQFAAGFLKAPSAELLARLAAHEADAADRLAREPQAPVDGSDGTDWLAGIDAVDAVDPDLFPIFEEEAQELLPRLARIEALATGGVAPRSGEIEALLGGSDSLLHSFEALRSQDAQAYAAALPAPVPATWTAPAVAPQPVPEPEPAPAPEPAPEPGSASAQEPGQLRGAVADLGDNLERLRQQLRDIELQAEMQMSSRLEATKAAAQAFDPLEFDRFTRFQELTRMMAESVNDVATVQRTLKRSLERSEDELAAQTRLTRDLQADLLRTRMVEFDTLAERLHRVVRQAAKETGKQARLDILGGSIELDRGMLERLTPAFEHLVRNAVTHGIESPGGRLEAGKSPIGGVLLQLGQQGNEVAVTLQDDGAGLDRARIRAKALARGLPVVDGEEHALIFSPGFSTADQLSELAGRGVGLDVVRTEVMAVGGRVEVASEPGRGTRFSLLLPLTTAVTQVLMLRCGELAVAVPATLVERVRRATPPELDAAVATGLYPYGDLQLPFHWLGALLEHSGGSTEPPERTRPVVVVRSAQQRLALHVDEVLGHQEAVVKPLGPQLSQLPGLAGMSVLASGRVALIYNPLVLAAVHGDAARAWSLAQRAESTTRSPCAASPSACWCARVTACSSPRTGWRRWSASPRSARAWC